MNRLRNQVRAYAWGSPTAIPRLLGDDPTGDPQAELWIGAHPAGSSLLAYGRGSLHDHITRNAPQTLGSRTLAQFGPRLPFLMKVLAAAAPLSLQVHPTTGVAARGFAAEEARGVAIDAPERLYKDASHKPELLYALGECESLCGFAPPTTILDRLDGLAAPVLGTVRSLLAPAGGADLKAALRYILTSPSVRGPAVDEVASACALRLAAGSLHPRHDAMVVQLSAAFPGDPGVVVAMLLNHVTLSPGEALFVPPGTLHAYLRGFGVEVMASSDNTLRGGLTAKHVDVEELLEVVDARPAKPRLVEPVAASPGELVFGAGVADFQLSLLTQSGERPMRCAGEGPSVILCLSGSLRVRAASERGAGLSLVRGQSLFAAAEDAPLVVEGTGTAVRASTGLPPAAAAAA